MKYLNEVWAMIPARSGSKGIKNKNIRIIGSKPLLAYSIISSKKSKLISKIVFSSDSTKYFNLAKKYGKIIFHKRPKKISKNSSADIELFMDFVKKYDGVLPKYFAHLRPTTPFRDSKLLDKVILSFINQSKKYSSLRSVSEISNLICKSGFIKNNKLYSPIFNTYKLDIINNSRQSYEKCFFGNGYVDVIKTENLFKGFMHGNKVKPFILKNVPIDIDNLKDLKNAKNSTIFNI